ncbi:MAG TPA: ATP-binding protein [Stellaceae bacterium]|nr:ATP-binding protein [Stellaceae bacterium]
MPSELAVIIDDSATSRKILERLTASLGGIATQSFADADGALSFCRDRCPGLVVLGRPAGGTRAADFVRSLRAVTAAAEIPVLVISSAEDPSAIECAREAGASDHLLAPVDHHEFRLRARHLLLRGQMPREAGANEAPDQQHNYGGEADRSNFDFLYNMSHELRTPLNAIIGFSQVIAGEMLGPVGTPKYAGYARDILDSAERLLGIVNDILDVSRLEAGTLELVEETIDFARTVADLLKLLEPRAEAASVQFALEHDGVIPSLRADERKLRQMLLNLLTNAIKFSHAGGVVQVVLRNVGGAIVIVIEDRGIGMDRHEVELAMTRFGQVATPWSRKHDGTGLGLPLAIGLAELHGANLSIDSTKDSGTTVTVAFPRERSEPLPDIRAAAAIGLA